MNWQTTGTIFLGLGILVGVVGLLLRFKAGRWLLAVLWLVLTLGSLLTGDWHTLSDNPDTGTSPLKASNYCLAAAGVCLLLGLVFRTLASQSI